MLAASTTTAQYGPTFSLSTSANGCALATATYIWDDVNNVWSNYDATFGFYALCENSGVPCDGLVEGTMKITKPTVITPY